MRPIKNDFPNQSPSLTIAIFGEKTEIAHVCPSYAGILPSRKSQKQRLLTLPPLSFRPMMLGWVDSLMIASTGNSKPVFGGTL